MNKLRNASVAILAATALTLSATPAMAQEDNTAEETKVLTNTSSESNTSSKIGDSLGASPSERGVWGSSKGESYDKAGNQDEVATPFGKLWYAYTIIATIASIVGLGGLAVTTNADTINAALKGAGIDFRLNF